MTRLHSLMGTLLICLSILQVHAIENGDMIPKGCKIWFDGCNPCMWYMAVNSWVCETGECEEYAYPKCAEPKWIENDYAVRNMISAAVAVSSPVAIYALM